MNVQDVSNLVVFGQDLPSPKDEGQTCTGHKGQPIRGTKRRYTSPCRPEHKIRRLILKINQPVPHIPSVQVARKRGSVNAKSKRPTLVLSLRKDRGIQESELKDHPKDRREHKTSRDSSKRDETVRLGHINNAKLVIPGENSENGQKEKEGAQQGKNEAVSRKDAGRDVQVLMSLKNIGELRGKSVSANFTSEDLILNRISEVSFEKSCARAKAIEILASPIYFTTTCESKISALKEKLNDPPIAAKLCMRKDTIPQKTPLAGQLPLLLGMKTLREIERSIKGNQAPYKDESGIVPQFRIISLLESVIKTLGSKGVYISPEFNWKRFRKIPLVSQKDASTHKYCPQSDGAIYQEKGGKRVPLVLFEASSKAGWVRKDDPPSDRNRLIIQGAFVANYKAAPVVVFYLRKDGIMETILCMPGDGDHSKIDYCVAERKPFYTEAGSLDVSDLQGDQPDQ